MGCKDLDHMIYGSIYGQTFKYLSRNEQLSFLSLYCKYLTKLSVKELRENQKYLDYYYECLKLLKPRKKL